MNDFRNVPEDRLLYLAKGGNKKACAELSRRYSLGIPPFKKDNIKALYWEQRSEDDFVVYSDANIIEDSFVNKMDTKECEQAYDWAITPDKNKHEYIIGIDFGHGETSAAYCSIGWGIAIGELKDPIDVDFGPNRKVIPSAINIMPDGQVYIGESAFSPERLKKADVEVCFKKKPENIDGEKEQLMIRFMHEVYKLIRERVGASLTNENHLVYIATPSGWKDEGTINLYGQMARKAGLPIAGITTESRAAFINAQQDVSSGLPQYVNQGAIVFDMGSSTLDFTYLKEGSRPIDFGYDCGASRVEKIMYEDIRNHNEDIRSFENKYPRLIADLLFKARCAKEAIYFDPEIRFKRTYNFEDIVDDEGFEDSKIKFVFQPGDLNQILEEKGYISEIRKAMIDFKENHIHNAPINAAFLTGGASRMNFIQELLEDCWRLPKDLVYRDQDPSLTISRGITVSGRGDIRSGGKGKTKHMFNEIMNKVDVYTPFINSLCEKVSDEIQATIATCVTNFRDNDTDVSLNDLQAYIEDNIGNDIHQIGAWAVECYKDAFEKQTENVRIELDRIVSNYSKQSITMKNGNVSILTSLPNIDLSLITNQMNQLGSSFTDDSFLKELAPDLAIGALGGVIAAILGGPLGLLIGGGMFLYRHIFGEEETEEQKRQKAMAKDLDKEQRQKVFDEFNQKWDSICTKIQAAVDRAIRNNKALRLSIQEQSQSVINDYVQECIRQTRLMFD